jgi:hypothetical protein
MSHRRVVISGTTLAACCVAFLLAPGGLRAAQEGAAGGPAAGGAPAGQTSVGHVIPAESCSQQDVQKAIDAAQDGDTVLLPAGEATWTPPGPRTPSVTIKGKVITLQGAGVDKTMITDGSPHAWNSLALVVQGGGKPFRLTGVTFRKGTDARGACAVSISDSRDWRVDHCKFEYNGVGSALFAYGDSFGVMDNCTIIRAYTGVNARGRGDASWKMPFSLGTAEAVYIEDCTFIDVGPDGPTDAYDGARYVFRHNTVTKTAPAASIGGIGHHGFDSGGMRSAFSCEVYGNTFTGDGWLFGRSRGGTGVIFDNTITGKVGFYLLVYYRSSDREDIKQLCAGWGPMCDGTNPLDGNEDATGYPGRDQPGRSTDAGREAPQLLEPVYEWNNALNGQDADLNVQDLGGKSFDHIKEGRDYYNDTPRPGYRPYAYPHPLRSQWPPRPIDTQKPSVPPNPAARRLSESQVELTWAAANDDVAVAGYYVWLNGQKVTTITDPDCTKYTFLRLKPPLNGYTFAVSAFDAAGNESASCPTVRLRPADPAAQTPSTTNAGG